MVRPPTVSVILASHNEGERLRQTVDSFLDTAPADGQLVVVDDSSTDDSSAFLAVGYRRVKLIKPASRLGAAEARNVGAQAADGDYLVFSDAHVELDAGWLDPLRSALDRPGVGAVAPAISSLANRQLKGFGHTWRGQLEWAWLPRATDQPYAVPFIPAGFLAIRRDTFQRIGGFDPNLLIWGSVGDEFSLRLWLHGLECRVVPEVDVAHLFRKQMPYELGWMPVLHNMMRMAVLHFNSRRVVRLFSELASRKAFDAAFSRLAAGDAWQRRESYRLQRIHDDDWFFARFNLSILDG